MKKRFLILTLLCMIFGSFYFVIFASGEESVCTHQIYNDSNTSTYHYKYCETCGKCNSRTKHYVYRYKNYGKSGTHSGYCSCGRYMGEYWHNYKTFNHYNDSYHIGICSCGYSTYLSHSWSGGDTSAHKCSTCGYFHSKQNDATRGRHYFDLTNISTIGKIASCGLCGAELELEYDTNTTLNKLPAKEEYTMVGNPKPMQPKSIEEDQYIVSNFMPIDAKGNIIPLKESSLKLRTYRNGNYYTHYSKLTKVALEQIADNLKYSEDKELLSFITQKLQELGTLGGYSESSKEKIIEEIIETVSGDKALEAMDALAIIDVVSKMGDFAIEAIKTPYIEWYKKDLEMKVTWLEGSEVTLDYEYNGDWDNSSNRKYKLFFSKLEDANYEIRQSKLLTEGVIFDIYSYTPEGFADLLYCTLFTKGETDRDEPIDILAYVSVGYRDINGNRVYNKQNKLATPNDSVISNVVYSGTTERSITTTINAQMEWTQLAGYRYKGYLIKYGNEKSGYYGLYNVPSNMKVTNDSSVEVTSSFTTQGLGISVVFYYEPVVVTKVMHQVGNVLINTNKNLYDVLLSQESDYDISDINYSPKDFTSLNKNFWPGYILTKCSVYKESVSKQNLIAEKIFDVDTTTKINSKDDAKRFVKIYPAITQSEGCNGYDIKITEDLGFGSNKIIVFEYMYPEVEIKNLNYETNKTVKDKSGKSIEYTIRLDGDNMLVKSLDTTLPENNKYKELTIKDSKGKTKTFKYDASDLSLVQVWIYTKDLNKNSYSLYKVLVSEEGFIPNTIGRESVEVVKEVSNFADGYILNTEELLTVINKVWSDLYIEFKYVEGANVLDVSYVDEENNILMPPERYKMVPKGEEIDVPVIELDNYKLLKYRLDEDVIKNVNNIKNVKVQDVGKDRKLVFVYTQNEVPEIPVGRPNYPYAFIKSNDNGSEEYDIEVAIPTNEDLYANVVTDSYILENALSILSETQKVNVILKKQYYTTSNDDENMITSNIAEVSAKNPLEFDLEYSYYGGENNQLFIIDNALIENKAVIDKDKYRENGKVQIDANYNGQIPNVYYEKGGDLYIQDCEECKLVKDKNGVYYIEILLGGIDYEKPDMDALVKSYQSDHTAIDRIIRKNSLVNGDYLSVYAEGQEIIYLNGLEEYMSAERLANVNELIATGYYNNLAKAPLINDKVLFKDRGVYTYQKAENKFYPTTLLTVNYISNISKETREKTYAPTDIKMNDINIYTPIVNGATLIPLNEQNESDNQLIDKSKENVLTLNSMFTIRIPHSGEHAYAKSGAISYKGYGTKMYNYKGTYLNDEMEFISKELSKKTFASSKLVKFSFDVYALKVEAGEIKDKKLILANKWFDLGSLNDGMSIEDYKFIIPVWVKDNETGSISVRVVAENIPEEYNVKTNQQENYISYENSNRKDVYVLQKDFNVFIAGSVYDLQIRDSDDKGWLGRLTSAINIKNNDENKNMNLPIGQSNQNRISAYKYGLKLGYRFFFDLKTAGVASNQIIIKPEFYYVSSDGSVATKDISIFYDTVDTKYIKLNEANDINKTLIMTNTHGEENNSEFKFELVRAKIKNPDKSYKYQVMIGRIFAGLVLNEIDVKLPLDNINALAKLYGYGTNTSKFISDAKKSNQVTDENDIRNATGHWYGEYYLPASTKVVMGTMMESNDVINNKNKLLEEGYLVVVFKEIKTTSNGNEYLTYTAPLEKTRWEKEGATYEPYEINLPNGTSATMPELKDGIAMAIYDLSLSAKDDYDTEGTH